MSRGHGRVGNHSEGTRDRPNVARETGVAARHVRQCTTAPARPPAGDDDELGSVEENQARRPAAAAPPSIGFGSPFDPGAAENSA